MKRKYFSVAVVLLLCSSFMFSSCIGSFSLTNKLLSWNRQIGNKFVNELVFFAFWILPVYEVSGLADILVLNSIEFWSGSNPVAFKGKQMIDGHDGKYLVECDGKGYTVTSQNDGSVVRLDFTEDDQTWTVTAGDQTFPLMTFVDETHVKLPAADGNYTVVELSDAGLYAYQQMATACQLAQR